MDPSAFNLNRRGNALGAYDNWRHRNNLVHSAMFRNRKGETLMNEQSLRDHLRLFEEKLLQPGIRKSVDDLDMLLADDFVEFGSSGRVFHKNDVIDGLLAEPAVKLTLSDFEIHVLAPNVVLTTYHSCRHSDMRHSLRSSIWKLNEGAWQMYFHQGTVTSAR